VGEETEAAAPGRNASVGANGAGIGASASQTSSAELSLTVNDQSRFTSLLGLLQANGYLHTIDMAASNSVVRREFAAVTPGSFIQLSGCVLTLPTYVQDEQVWRAAKGRVSIRDFLTGTRESAQETIAAKTAVYDRFVTRHPNRKPPTVGFVGGGGPTLTTKQLREARSEMNSLVRRVGTNPQVPLSSCSPYRNDGDVPDLLMPLHLGDLSSSQSAVAGQLTLVGKVVLILRGAGFWRIRAG
jgi:hypothetical protein